MTILDFDRPGRGYRIQPFTEPEAGIWVEGGAITQTEQVMTEARNYTNDTRHAIVWDAATVTASVELTFNTNQDMELLRSWKHRLIVVRSVRGEVVVGVISDFAQTGAPRLPRRGAIGSLTMTVTTDGGGLIPTDKDGNRALNPDGTLLVRRP